MSSTCANNIGVWFRADLRLADNPALYHATQMALNPPAAKQQQQKQQQQQQQQQPKQPTVYALYVISPAEWSAHDVSPVKVDFILRNLRVLSNSLWSRHRIPLVIKHASSASQVHDIVDQFCAVHSIRTIFWNKEYEVNETRRDRILLENFSTKQIQVFTYDDQVVVSPGELRAKSSGNVYTVYSPFKRAWFDLVRQNRFKYLTELKVPDSFRNSDDPSIACGDKVPPINAVNHGTEFQLTSERLELLQQLYPAGEDAAHTKLNNFCANRSLPEYEARRNFPNLADGTSGMSPYLAAGVVSAKQCVLRAAAANGNKLDSGSAGVVCYIQELIWRDFYRHILWAFPRVCMNQPFKLETKRVKWRSDPQELAAWIAGKTGYPIVDAGMRQLNETGWMHNRVRMIVASFLTKHLLHNWQEGERYFMRNLIDGDFASNNGGWQWAASTGTDSQPYFRVFNPLLQSQRFDPDGVYIRRWVPELRGVKSNAAVHAPDDILGKKEVERLGYVCKIVPHESSRKRAIEAFKMAAAQTTGADSSSEDNGDDDKKQQDDTYGKKKSTKTKKQRTK